MLAESSTAADVQGWLIAGGTVGAVLVAIFGTTVWDWLRRPKLSLHWDARTIADAQTIGIRLPGSKKGGTRAAFARLRVRNEPRKRTAEDVEVLVEGVRLGPPDAGSDGPRDSEAIGDMPLPASNSDPTSTTLNIPPGVERHFDFVHLDKTQVEGLSGSRIVRFDVHPRPEDLRHNVYGGDFEVDLVVAARNASARRYTARVTFDGTWPDDELQIWEHFNVALTAR